MWWVQRRETASTVFFTFHGIRLQESHALRSQPILLRKEHYLSQRRAKIIQKKNDGNSMYTLLTWGKGCQARRRYHQHYFPYWLGAEPRESWVACKLTSCARRLFFTNSILAIPNCGYCCSWWNTAHKKTMPRNSVRANRACISTGCRHLSRRFFFPRKKEKAVLQEWTVWLKLLGSQDEYAPSSFLSSCSVGGSWSSEALINV